MLMLVALRIAAWAAAVVFVAIIGVQTYKGLNYTVTRSETEVATKEARQVRTKYMIIFVLIIVAICLAAIFNHLAIA